MRFSGEFCQKKTVGIENEISSSMKTLDTLDSYSLVTWSGSQEDPSMVRQGILFHTNVRFLAGLVNDERWRPGRIVEGSHCGDNECEANSGLPL